MLHIPDNDVASIIQKESNRQEYSLELIASENFVSQSVLSALGCVLTNKYAEGYPGKRYYGGCEHVDEIENLARERAKTLFGCEHVNVQPHSGSQANMAVYFSALQPGDTIMGMNLSHGGHLTHGSPVSMSGSYFNVVSYGVNSETELIDYDDVAEKAHAHRPKLIVCGASAYSRDIDFQAFRDIADSVDAKLLADIAHPAGLVAAKLHSSPIPYCDYVTTTTHKTLRGPRGGMIMCKEKFAKKIDKAIFPGIQGGPLMHVIAAKAVGLGENLMSEYVTYCQQIIANSKQLAKTLSDRGYRIVSGGTDTHLLLVDLTNKGLTGKLAESILENAGMTTNKNTVPNETRSPFITSGIRLGTPALTTRGMKEVEMSRIGNWIADVLESVEDDQLHMRIRSDIRDLCQSFPLYQGE